MILNDVKIISSGSKGNAAVINDKLLIDCGVAYKAIEPYTRLLKLVLLTHIHSDHFKKTTIKRLAGLRPNLRWGCCEWLVKPLLDCGVSKYQIDVYKLDTAFVYSMDFLTVEPFRLYHDVENCGYKINILGKKILYATDTCKIETEAQGYDLYMLEANYEEDELQERINRKEEAGEEYIYELKVKDNHLSRAMASEFVMNNAAAHSEHIFLHVHEDKNDERH